MPTKKKKTSRKLNVSPEEELDVLRTIVEITNSDLNLDKALKEVVKVVNDMTKADSVFIYMFNDQRKHLVLMASKTPHKKELGQVTLKAGEGITGWVAKENQPVAISKDASLDKRFKKFDVLPEDQYEAFLSVPIVHKTKAIGVVNVQHRDPHEYAEGTIDLIMLIAKQISGTLEHARLYEETRKKAVQFDSLTKVSQSIISKDYLDEILNLIVVVTGEMLNSKICSIMLVDSKGKDLIVKATHALTDSFRKRPAVRISGSLSGEAVQKKIPIVVEDVQANSKFQHRDLALQEDLSSVCIVPMVVKNQAIGVVSVYTKEPHAFTDEEVAVMQIIANQAAVAVENTKLVDEMVRAKEALETRKLVERAKGILMRMNNLTEEAAHRLIHKKAMDSCKSMKDIAESIILMEELSS